MIIPPRKEVQRIDLPDQYFKSSEDQFEAVIEETLKRHATGQPVLLIASLISDTELLSKILVQKGIEHSVLNANNAFWEAEIVKEAGQKNTVTVATSMAGRGTDIHLGAGVKELGGLCVIGVGRMENVRTERQARGRAGRQGEPGVSIFYCSLEDDVVSSVMGDKIIEKYVDEDKPISMRKIKRMINKSQQIKEESSVMQRKNAMDYDSCMKRQRGIMYDVRNELLDGKNMDEDFILRLIEENINSFVAENKNLTETEIRRYIYDHLSYKIYEVKKDTPLEYLNQFAKVAFKEKKKQIGSRFDEFCRLCTLQALDDGWVEEVDYLQQLQSAISGRQSAQRNILFEYQREARSSFTGMEKSIKNAMVRNILLADVSYNEDKKMIVLYP